jgi:hypothetical protein
LARFASRRILGEIPETAKTGSFDVDVATDAKVDDGYAQLSQKKMTESDAADLLDEVSQQLGNTSFGRATGSNTPIVDQSDEALFQEIFDDKAVPTGTNANVDKKAKTATYN